MSLVRLTGVGSMRKTGFIGLICAGLLACALSGCGNTAALPDGSDSDGSVEAVGATSAPESVTEEASDCYTLQGEAESGTLEILWTEDGAQRTFSTPTLNGDGTGNPVTPEIIPFTDIMGCSGFCESHPRAGSNWSERYYYAVDMGDNDDAPVCIAESFGQERNDYSLDLNGDGVTELICNCTYIAADSDEVHVFRRENDTFLESTVDKSHMLTENGSPAEAIYIASGSVSYYDGGQKIFFFSYQNDAGDWLEWEALWPEDFTEAPYEPDYESLISDES